MGLSAILIYDELVAKCKQGDVQSFETLYHKYARPMLNTSLRIVNNASDAEDVLQESFASAFQHLDRFDYTSTFGAWLKRIVVNNSITVLRRRKLAFIDITESAALDIEENKETVDDDIEFRVDSIKKAMSSLPNGYRSVLSLFLFEGYDYEEIGEILNISESTVRTQYHRAKQKLLNMINQEAHDE